MSDRMPADLPVTKCINVMVGITRSKGFFLKKLRFFIYLNLLIGSASKSNFWQYSNRVIKEMVIDFEIENTSFFLFRFLIYFSGPLRNPILGNMLLRYEKEISLILKSKIIVFFNQGFRFINRVHFEIQFLAISLLRFKRKFN